MTCRHRHGVSDTPAAQDALSAEDHRRLSGATAPCGCSNRNVSRGVDPVASASSSPGSPSRARPETDDASGR